VVNLKIRGKLKNLFYTLSFEYFFAIWAVFTGAFGFVAVFTEISFTISALKRVIWEVVTIETLH